MASLNEKKYRKSPSNSTKCWWHGARARSLPQSCPTLTASSQSGFVECVTLLVQQAAVEDSSSPHQGRLGAETTFSLHVCADTHEKISPPRSVDADGLPFLYLRMNILLGDKRGFVLQVMVDVIHCHHTDLVNNTDTTVESGCLYVPDLQPPPLPPQV